MYLSGSAAALQAHGPVISLTEERRGSFLTFELTGWPHCRQKTRHLALVFRIASATQENISWYGQRARNYKVECMCLYRRCFRSVFDGFNQPTRELNSVNFGSSFDPQCCQGSLRDGSGIRRELGSLHKQAVSPALCQNISCLTRLSPKLIT